MTGSKWNISNEGCAENMSQIKFYAREEKTTKEVINNIIEEIIDKVITTKYDSTGEDKDTTEENLSQSLQSIKEY